MIGNFDACLAIILKEEGGNDDDVRDPGGRTSRGIIQREWNVYRQTHPNRPQDVWQASSTDVADIYKTQYWEPYCDKMPLGVDLVFFNASVNSGRQQAVKELQRSLGVNADGMMGMITFNALDAEANLKELIEDMCTQRRNFYKALKTFKTFGKGWMARTDRIQSSAIAMAQNAPTKVIVSEHPEIDTKPSQPKITVSPKAPTTDAGGPAVPPESSGTATAGAGSLIAILNSIQNQLQQFSGTFQAIQYVLLAIVVIGIIYTIYGYIKQNNVKQAIG